MTKLPNKIEKFSIIITSYIIFTKVFFMANILTAIKTIINFPISELVSYYQIKNRINQMVDALECFIKDIFADTVNESDQQKKLLRYSEVFSYSGNANNPPDLILRNGDALEIKKIESLGAGIALNSSYSVSRISKVQ